MITKQTEGGVIPDHCWYYLLAWNDWNHHYRIEQMFGPDKNGLPKGLRDLTEPEFWKLFDWATKVDLEGKTIAE